MLKAQNINKNYASSTVLSNVSFSVGKGQRIALVGHNGTGKTTLLKILAGIEAPDSGKVDVSSDACIGYLPQDTSLTSDESIIDYLKRVSGVAELEREIELLSTRLDDPEKAERYSTVSDRYEHLNGYTFDRQAEVMLAGFGLEAIDSDRPLSALSSGQKSKVALVGILLKGVDLLLLDEPTNNLDLPALIWLENFIIQSEATCIIVSHDRRFLDNVANKILELDWSTHSVTMTGGKYSDYLDMIVRRASNQKEEYRLQQEEISRLTDQAAAKKAAAKAGSNWKASDNDKFLRGFKRDRAAKSSKVAKAIEKRIEHMDKIERPVERRPLEIRLTAEVDTGALNIRLTDLVVGYVDGFKVGPVNLDVQYGQRIGIMGLNGSGKSTLLKTITAQMIPLGGKVDIGSGIRIGNMMQEHETLPRTSSAVGLLMERGNISEGEAYSKLVKFGFGTSQSSLPIANLSPGGRARLLLALFSVQSVNVLVLDEPTNHLDLEALAAIEETLESYRGTVILVSHDRYFLEHARLDEVYLLTDGNLTSIPDYQTYITLAKERAQKLIRLL